MLDSSSSSQHSLRKQNVFRMCFLFSPTTPTPQLLGCPVRCCLRAQRRTDSPPVAVHFDSYLSIKKKCIEVYEMHFRRRRCSNHYACSLRSTKRTPGTFTSCFSEVHVPCSNLGGIRLEGDLLSACPTTTAALYPSLCLYPVLLLLITIKFGSGRKSQSYMPIRAQEPE